MFLTSGIIAFIYLIVKFIEMRMEKENKPLKHLIRDALLVYFSVIIGLFTLGQLKPVMQDGIIHTNPAVFTDNPGF